MVDLFFSLLFKLFTIIILFVNLLCYNDIWTSYLIINFWARFKREVLLVANQHRRLVFYQYMFFNISVLMLMYE